MSSNNEDIQDSLRSTQSQSNQQKEKEARRDAEDRIHNFNYAKSIGNTDGNEEEIKPLSPLAQRYLSSLKGNRDGEDDDGGEDAAASSISTVQERKIAAVPDNSARENIDDDVEDDNASYEEYIDAAIEEEIDNTTATVAAESTTNQTPNNFHEDDAFHDAVEKETAYVSAEIERKDPLPTNIDDGERSSDLMYKDMSAGDNDEGEFDAKLDSSASDNREVSTKGREDDEDESDIAVILAAAAAVGAAVAGGTVVASTMNESEVVPPAIPNEGDDHTTNVDSSDICQSIPENVATDNDNMSTNCIDGEEEPDEDDASEEDKTQYCGTVAGTIATGALAQPTNDFSDQSDHAVVDEESQVTSATSTPQDDDQVSPPAQSPESEALPSSEDEIVDQPSRRLSWLLILCVLAVVVAVVAGMGVGVDRGLNSVNNASILIPVPTQSPTSEPSLSASPSDNPSKQPTVEPSRVPSSTPTLSAAPSSQPTVTSPPTISSAPTSQPSDQPTLSTSPSSKPSTSPSISSEPSDSPSESPSLSTQPSDVPSMSPSVSAQPSDYPSSQPTTSTMPSSSPSAAPTASVSSSLLYIKFFCMYSNSFNLVSFHIKAFRQPFIVSNFNAFYGSINFAAAVIDAVA